MTNSISDLLAQVITESDSFDALKSSARELTGIEIDGLYCLHTGKLIGRFDRVEIQEAIFEEGGDDSDEEQLIDSLVVRVIASMRPSPALNKPDMGTIREMSQRRPVDCLAFLMNRLYGNASLLRTRSDDAFSILRGRIDMHKRLTALHDSGFDFAPYTHWLLEIDSKINLHTITPPDFDVFSATLETFETWAFKLLDKARMMEVNAAREASWHKGNRMTRAATIRSHLDNPEIANRKLQAAYDLKQKAKAARPASKRKPTQVDQFMGLLDSIINNASSADEAAIATHKKPAARTAGMLFRKKESN